MKTTALSMTLVALLLAAPVTTHADEDVGKIMDLAFEDTDVKQVITRIAELAGKNVIMSPKVKGRVTVKLSGTPWRAALEHVAGAVGAVVLEEDFGILRVIPAAEKPAAAKPPRVADLDASARERLDRLRADLADVEARIADAHAEGNERRVASLQRRLEHERKRLEAYGRHVGVTGAALRALAATGSAGGQGKKPRVHTTTVTKEGQQQVLITMGRDGRIIRKRVIEGGKGGDVVVLDDGRVLVKGKLESYCTPSERADHEAAIQAAQKRVEGLAAATAALEAAALHAEAKRLHARMAEARAALDAARQRMAAAEAAAKARARAGVPFLEDVPGIGRLYKGASAHGAKDHAVRLDASLQALRKDVHALRGEVRALTGLVKQLLKQRGAGVR